MTKQLSKKRQVLKTILGTKKRNCVDNFSEKNEPKTECKDKSQEDNEEIDVSDNSETSIQRFWSLLSCLAGGDSYGYPDIEALQASQPAREEEIRQAATSAWRTQRIM